jgi:hypothetical protein
MSIGPQSFESFRRDVRRPTGFATFAAKFDISRDIGRAGNRVLLLIPA